MLRKTIPALVALTFALGNFVAPLRADEIADKGRAIFNKNQHAVVTVEVVLKITYSSGGQASPPQETKQEATGTVIDPSGLTVLALSACDPGDLYQRMAEQSRYKVETEVSDIKIMLDDGTELPAEIVLRDKDLDLAYVRPKTKPASPMTAIDLSKSAPAQVLDEVIALNRLNRAVSRAYSASVERISAVVQKPRTFYIPDSTMSATTMGSPAFMLNGDVLGIFVMRAVSPAGGRANLAAIILPAEDILKGAKQAPEVKPEAEKKEEPKAPAKERKAEPEKK
jgi:S1-C subfamily serine protease